MIEPAFSYEGLRLTSSIEGGQPIEMADTLPGPAQFAREADYFADCVFNDRQPKISGEEGLRDERLIAAIYESCSSGRAVKV